MLQLLEKAFFLVNNRTYRGWEIRLVFYSYIALHASRKGLHVLSHEKTKFSARQHHKKTKDVSFSDDRKVYQMRDKEIKARERERER